MLAGVVRLVAAFAAQFPAGGIGDGLTQTLAGGLVLGQRQSLDARCLLGCGRVSVKLYCQLAAGYQLDCFAQRHIALTLAVGFDRQAVVVFEDAGNDIAHILRDVRLTVAAIDGARVGITVSCGNGYVHF